MSAFNKAWNLLKDNFDRPMPPTFPPAQQTAFDEANAGGDPGYTPPEEGEFNESEGTYNVLKKVTEYHTFQIEAESEEHAIELAGDDTAYYCDPANAVDTYVEVESAMKVN